MVAEGLKLDEEAGSKKYEELLGKYESICAEEGETVKAVSYTHLTLPTKA